MQAIFIRSSFLVFLLPLFIFIAFWIQSWLAVPIILASLYLIATTKLELTAFEWTRFSTLKVIIALLILLLSQWLVGYTGDFPQHSDFSARNAQYGTLCREAWPVFSEENNPFVYYFHSWLPSALLSKITAFEYRNIFQLTFNWIYISLGYLLLCLKCKKITLLPLIAFFALGDLFTIFESICSPFIDSWRFWNYRYLFDLRLSYWNIEFQLFSTVNHAAILVLGASLALLNYKSRALYLFTGACAFLYSPMGAIGLFPIIVIQAFRKGWFYHCKRLSLSPATYLSFSIVIIGIIFYTQVDAANSQLTFGLFKINKIVRHLFVIYIVGQSIFFLLLFYPSNKKSPLFCTALIVFLILPFVSYGNLVNEILFKASLPLWVLFSYYFFRIFQAKLPPGKITFNKLLLINSKLLASLMILGLIISKIFFIHSKIENFRHPNNTVDPYRSDYYSEEAKTIKAAELPRDFGGMKDAPSTPKLPYILRESP